MLSGVFLTRISSTVFRLALTAEQTALFAEGAVEGDFIQRIGGVDLPYGLRLTIAVSDVIR